MIYINHRINTVEQLAVVPPQNGIELDVRYHNDDLVLHHDPFGHHRTNPTLLEDLLAVWDHDGPLILNVKTEGVELECINMLRKFCVTNWFFLDLSMPFFAIYAEHATQNSIDGFSMDNLAVRFSEREPIEYALAFAGQARWVWVDCFTTLPLTEQNAIRLNEAGFHICIVSPELQLHDISRIVEFRKKLAHIPVQAVCTKRPDLWGQPPPLTTTKNPKICRS